MKNNQVNQTYFFHAQTKVNQCIWFTRIHKDNLDAMLVVRTCTVKLQNSHNTNTESFITTLYFSNNSLIALHGHSKCVTGSIVLEHNVGFRVASGWVCCKKMWDIPTKGRSLRVSERMLLTHTFIVLMVLLPPCHETV